MPWHHTNRGILGLKEEGSSACPCWYLCAALVLSQHLLLQHPEQRGCQLLELEGELCWFVTEWLPALH